MWELQLQVGLLNIIYLQSSLARRPAYVGAGSAGVGFRPDVSISLMQFGLGGQA